MNNKLENSIQRLVNSRDNEETKEIYAEWQSYDSDLDEYGYVAPQTATTLLMEQLADKNATIFDAGCGTGKVGTLLHAAGYQQLEGADLSESMLSRAQSLGIYKNLSTADFSKTLDQADASFDAVISVGVWKDGFGEKFTHEMVRLAKNGATIVVTVRPQFMPALESVLDSLTNDGVIQVVSNQVHDYIKGQNSTAHYVVLRKSA